MPDGPRRPPRLSRLLSRTSSRSARTSSSAWRDVARRYAFVEYDGPPLEPLELYTRKSGDEIVGQLYNFTDKGGREVALRPEMTPTFARMVAARANALRKPVRWFSMPQLFRYERQQRGRLREHFQLNVDIVGEADVTADAELLAVAIDIMRAFGLTSDDVARACPTAACCSAMLGALGVSEERRMRRFARRSTRSSGSPARGLEEKLAALGRRAVDGSTADRGARATATLDRVDGAAWHASADGGSRARSSRYFDYLEGR